MPIAPTSINVSGRRVRVGVQVGDLRVPLRVGLVFDRNHAAGQGAAAAPVAAKPEGIAAGNVVVVGVLEEETLRGEAGSGHSVFLSARCAAMSGGFFLRVQ